MKRVVHSGVKTAAASRAPSQASGRLSQGKPQSVTSNIKLTKEKITSASAGPFAQSRTQEAWQTHSSIFCQPGLGSIAKSLRINRISCQLFSDTALAAC